MALKKIALAVSVLCMLTGNAAVAYAESNIDGVDSAGSTDSRALQRGWAAYGWAVPGARAYGYAPVYRHRVYRHHSYYR